MYANLWQSNKIDHTERNLVGNVVTVIGGVCMGGKILGEDHDHHKQTIEDCSLCGHITCWCSNPNLQYMTLPLFKKKIQLICIKHQGEHMLSHGYECNWK